LRHLEALGTRSGADFPVIAVPGRPHLCHAAGLFRRRVLVSSEFSTVLSPSEMRAALAHEIAHLRRHDPAVRLLIAFASLFAVPAAARLLSAHHGQAVEEACDAEAAAAVSDPGQVALALVKVAQLRHRWNASLAAVPAFGEIALEQRVRLLLADTAPVVSRSAAPAIGVLGMLAVAGLTWRHAPEVHHAVESALNHIF
jgi:Zn-dependent protease with chaperone function